MARALVIVESPAKAKTINKFLGKGYQVRASMRYIRDLPRRSRKGRSRPVHRCIAASGAEGEIG